MKRLLSFHSLVFGKVAVLLVAVVKVDPTRDAFVIVALLEDVVVNHLTRRDLRSEPFTGRLLALTANSRV